MFNAKGEETILKYDKNTGEVKEEGFNLKFSADETAKRKWKIGDGELNIELRKTSD